jgi:hypothetical protein
MTPNGTIQLHLRAATSPVTQRGGELTGLWSFLPWSSVEETGYGEIQLQPGDLYYGALLRHLGGLQPGETKLVPVWRTDEKWHCALDPRRGSWPLQHLLPST